MEQISIIPHGLALGQGTFRPAMIFKDKDEVDVLPVWLDPNEVHFLLASTQVDVSSERTPHKATLKIFEATGLSLESVYFNEVTNATQFAEIMAVQGKTRFAVRVKASEVMSLALKSGCAFYTNKDVIEKSRTLNFQMVLHQDLVQVKDLGALH